MSDTSQPSEELVKLYMEAAQRAIEGAQYNLDGGYFGIAASRAYYAFFYARRFIARVAHHLTEVGYS